MKGDLRKVVMNTTGWDDAMPQDLRNKWLKNFLRLESMRGIKFHRPIMPIDAVDRRMYVKVLVDAAGEHIMLDSYGSFKRKDGSFSCQFLLGRPLLGDLDKTIPKMELEALTGGSNLGWVIRKALEGGLGSLVWFVLRQ